MSTPAEPAPTPRPAPASAGLGRVLPLALIGLISLAVIALCWHEHLSPATLIERRAAVDSFVAAHRIAALTAFAVIYAVSVALSLPGAALLTIGGGAIFGTLAGGIAALIGATVGATGIFLAAKSAFGGWLARRAGGRAETLAAGFCADAFNYLLFLRLVPVFPFWLVNLVPALVGVRLGTFVVATAIGIIPGTFAFAFFGAGLDSAVTSEATAYRACVAAGGADCRIDFVGAATTPGLVGGLVALGLLALVPVAVRRYKAARRRGASRAETKVASKVPGAHA
jgi:uncharacterized membrane protein YdjX (TVP38/TMEM64 family)